MKQDEYLYLWAQWGILKCKHYRAVMKHFGSLTRAWKEVTPQFFRELGMYPDKIRKMFEIRQQLDFEDMMNTMKRFDIQFYHLEDEVYPSFLKNSSVPPPFLFVRGKLPPFHKSISVVGTRAMTSYGRVATEKLTADLVRQDFVIVSGLALGIDSVAHKTAVDNHGLTVAVLGSGVDKIYPSSNYRLAQDILSSGGAILSDYPLGTSGEAHHFPQRNYIIAGLTKGTLVIEGGQKSGALITARCAHEEGREVFAVPSNITRYALSGPNKLIRRGEAKMVENIDHIIEDLGMQPTLMKEIKSLSAEERFLLERLAGEGKTMDQLIDETPYNIPQLAQLVVQLQLKGVIAEQGQRFVLT